MCDDLTTVTFRCTENDEQYDKNNQRNFCWMHLILYRHTECMYECAVRGMRQRFLVCYTCTLYLLVCNAYATIFVVTCCAYVSLAHSYTRKYNQRITNDFIKQSKKRERQSILFQSVQFYEPLVCVIVMECLTTTKKQDESITHFA